MRTSRRKYFRKPIFIIGSPRSGTSLTYMLLGSSPGVWSTFAEDQWIFETALGLRIDPTRDVEERGVFLDEKDATPERCDKIYDYFWQEVVNPGMFRFSGFQSGIARKVANRLSRYIRLVLRIPVRMIHKNPRNTFRISFLRAVFQDARFVFVFRDGRANVSSLLEGWGEKRFHTFQVPVRDNSEDEVLRQWAFELPPKWREWAGKSLPEVCAFQWVSHNEFMLNSEQVLPKGVTVNVRFEDLLDNTTGELRRLCQFLDLPIGRALLKAAETPPPVASVSPPKKDKWLDRREEIESVRYIIQPMMDRLGYSWDE